MYAKSMIDWVRDRYPNGTWIQHLGALPVLLALGVAALLFRLPVPTEQSGAVLPDQPTAHGTTGELVTTHAHAPNAGVKRAVTEDRRQRLVAEFMARKYRVSVDAVQDLVRTAHAAGKQLGLDPQLLVAVMSVESGFNPIAESVAGAKGLMQVIPKYHLDKLAEFGGEQAILDPRANIIVGAKILKEYLLASGGDLFAALQTYAGGITDEGLTYSNRVLNEKDRLDELLGLPKTNRGTRMVKFTPPQATPQDAAGRVHTTIPTAPTGAGAAVPAATPEAKPAETIAQQPAG